jgi:hypothetical protein
LFFLGCDSGFPGAEGKTDVTESQFVDAVVELRRAALAYPNGRVPHDERDRLLAARGLSAEKLEGFVEVHGVNVPYMGRIWATIEQRLGEQVQGGLP